MKGWNKLAVCTLFAALLSVPAQANSSIWVYSNQAEADIVTGDGQITITLIDKVLNASSVTGNLSAFIFTTDVTPTSESLTSSSAYERTLTGKGVGQYTDSANPVDTGWALALVSATTSLDVLAAGGVGPEHTIIGAPGANNAYSKANGSLLSGPHNPFLDGTATFVIAAAGVTAATTITAATFQFGTAEGSNRFAAVDPPAVPEPATWATLGGGLLALFVFARNRCARSPHSAT